VAGTARAVTHHRPQGSHLGKTQHDRHCCHRSQRDKPTASGLGTDNIYYRSYDTAAHSWVESKPVDVFGPSTKAAAAFAYDKVKKDWYMSAEFGNVVIDGKTVTLHGYTLYRIHGPDLFSGASAW
jgi:hypothetical protein